MTKRISLMFAGVCASIIVVASGMYVVHAEDQGLDMSTYQEDSGLSNDQYAKLCEAESIVSGIEQLQAGYAKQYLDSIKSTFTQTFEQMIPQLAQCAMSSFTAYGTGFAGMESCVSDMGGSLYAQMKEQALTKLKDDFLNDCTARSALDDMLDTTDDIIANYGRDGGPAFVQDWRAFQAQGQYRGLQIARNIMANTNYCPWVGGLMSGYFNFDSSQAVAMVGQYEDGYQSYTSEAGCGLPDGFDPTDPETQTTEALAAMLMPSNNISGSYLLAQDNIQRQIAAEELADEREYARTGGIGGLREKNPATGTSCAVMAPDGTTCLQYSAIKQSAAGVVAEVNAKRQAQYDWVTSPHENQIQDVRLRLYSSLLDATTKAIDTEFEFDKSDKKIIADSQVTPTPASCPVAIPAGCTCVANDANSQAISQTAVLQATRDAITQHPELVTPDGSSVLPGMERVFLAAICSTNTFQSGNCHPHPAASNSIVVGAGISFSITVIGDNGIILQPGRTIAACPAGIQ